MQKLKLLEKKIKELFRKQGSAVGFVIDEVLLENGKTATREYLDHPGSVSVVPLTKDGNIVMVKQYRYPVGSVTLETPAGKMHYGHDVPIERAKAELKEETGYTAENYTLLMEFLVCPAFSNELQYIYMATGLKPGEAMPDEDEFLKVEEVPLNTALEMIKSGEIKDSKTIAGIQAVALLNK